MIEDMSVSMGKVEGNYDFHSVNKINLLTSFDNNF